MKVWALLVLASCYRGGEHPPAAVARHECRREHLADEVAEMLVVDDRHVYVASYMGGIHRISLRGGNAEPFEADVNIMGLAVDDTHAYWTSLSGDRSVKRRAKAGGAVEILASSPLDPQSIVVDDHAVYWTTVNGRDVMRWHKRSRSNTAFARGSGGLALDRGHVYWTRGFDEHGGVVGVGRKAKTGGESEIFGDTGIDYLARQVTSDGERIYWTVKYFGGLRRSSGPEAETFSLGPASNAAPVPSAGDLAVDATHAYWESGGTLLRRSKRGGAVEVVVPGERTIRAFAITADVIYWTSDRGTFRLRKAPCGL